MQLLPIFYTVALVLAMKIATHEGMVLHPLKLRAEETGKKIFEPLILCEWCMPSIYTLLGYGFFFIRCGFHWKELLFYPISLGISSAIAGSIWAIILILLSILKILGEHESE